MSAGLFGIGRKRENKNTLRMSSVQGRALFLPQTHCGDEREWEKPQKSELPFGKRSVRAGIRAGKREGGRERKGEKFFEEKYAGRAHFSVRADKRRRSSAPVFRAALRVLCEIEMSFF